MSIPIIDREIFFGNPEIMGGQISPDGNFISFIKPYQGMLNIWVKETDESFSEAQPLTNDQTRPITSYFWSRDSRYIMYVQDSGGDENFHIHAVDVEQIKSSDFTGIRDITNYGEVRAIIYKVLKRDHDRIIVGLNDRDPSWHDLYEINITTGERKLIYENIEQISGYIFDLDEKLRLGYRATPDGGTEVLKRTEAGWDILTKSSGDEELSILQFKDDQYCYVKTNIGHEDLAFLGILDTNSANIELVEKDPDDKVDLGNAIFSTKTDLLLATVYTFEKLEIYWRDLDFKSDYEHLKKKFEGAQIGILSSTSDESRWIITVNSDIDPGATYFYDRETKDVKFLYRSRPELPLDHLCQMKPISYSSVDDLTIHGYLTLPKWHGARKAAIVMPHGGPWVRDTWGYHSYAQFLANRGYAVLQVNYRGSTGYGKAFLNAGDLEWGKKMQDDLTYGAQFLIENGICDDQSVGILGGSYGGYATLAGLTFTPDAYACGVSIVGPSNLFTLLESIPPYWEAARAMFHKRMGNPNTEEGQQQLRAQSPFFHAANIKVPLLVAQGDNDPRVKTAESEQIVSAMKEHGLDVAYVNFPDEGHGFANPLNNMAFIAVMEKFLAEHLGGRYQADVPDHLQEIIERVTIE